MTDLDVDLKVALVKNLRMTSAPPGAIPVLAVIAPLPDEAAPPLPRARIHHPSPDNPALAICDQLDRDVQLPELAPEARWVWTPGSPLHVTCQSCREWRHA